MKFWEDEKPTTGNHKLYNEYLEADLIKSKRPGVIIKLMEEDPQRVPDWIWNRLDSVFGPHTVYLIEILYKGKSYLKIGYTKNSTKERFSEKRYDGADDFKLVRILNEVKLQALGAVQFEDEIKQKVTTIKTDMKMPGKGEIFDMSKLDEILSVWNESLPKFREVIGIKAPN